MPIRALEFYSGIGGLHLALTRSCVDGRVVKAFDWDQTACRVYGANHSPGIVRRVDISTLTAIELGGMKADLWLLSPACQPYTVLNPLAKGAQDPRAQSFLHLVQTVLPALANTNTHPAHLLVENVAGFENSSTQQVLLSTLRSIGYTTLELLLTPLQYGIPNSRLRYYLLAKKSPLRFQHVSAVDSNSVWRHIPGQPNHWQDPRVKTEPDASSQFAVDEVRKYLDTTGNTPIDCKVPDKVLQKWGRLFDIALPSSRRTCCFTRGYTHLAERSGSVLQQNELLDTTRAFDKFLAADSVHQPEAIQFLHPLHLRYFSPSELLRIFGFDPNDGTPASFKWPEGVSKKSKYRLIGNSVNVRVVQEVIEYLFEAS